ncbi:hypothetical protein JHK87_011800 [Glycine soja]|nr:hypothetical protein JHK87_011800 [Glycine soja]
MARALCELQLELQNGLPCTIVVSGNSKGESEGFIPKTLASKETRRNKVSTKDINLTKKQKRETKRELSICDTNTLFDSYSSRCV